ncbi:phenylalanyl-tRNA synthetase subunit beta [Mycoplasmopsis gallinacea]|uniref:phenylalanine--tRNA ligase n=1 Tax=Mycoplasmopsis gallinacea TaxID=29556 RepID=A0A0D5ZJH9_9BACT|nr:phenylalanyl-tRNA synthetase subunit beta [Mycoplasmopsis gallinacea]
MVFSLNYLNKFLPNKKLDASIEIALNELGFEVEEIKPFSDVKGVIFAKVISKELNPNTPKLDVVLVETKLGNLTIQTNNQILNPGDLTVIFPIGSSKGDHVFGEATIKGVNSQGMFGAFSELGYDWELLEKENQVLKLPSDFASLEDDPMQVLGLDDLMVEVSTTANRNDANSYYVLARELAAYYKTDFVFDFKKPSKTFVSQINVQRGDADNLNFLETKGKVLINFEDKLLLAKSGIDTKHPDAVNLTNLTLLITGAPTHVYNKDLIGDNLTAKMFSGSLTIFGNKEVDVKDIIAIYDENGPISIASVMGLEAFKVEKEATNLCFEIGIFKNELVRHAAKEIKLLSNSASQGSRVISKEATLLGIKFIQSYLSNLEQSNLITTIDKVEQNQIQIDNNKLKTYAQVEELSIFHPAIEQLKMLGYIFDEKVVTVPNYRYDVVLFEDIIEEIFRFYSYTNFKPITIKNKPIKVKPINKDKAFLLAQGYNEARTFTLVSKERNTLNPFNFESSIDLLTFVSKERETVRNSIITSLSEIVLYNQKRKMSEINFFEKGMINYNVQVYGLASTTKGFFEIKRDIVNFLKDDALTFVPWKDCEFIHPNVSAKIYKGDKLIGWIGKIHPRYDETGAFYAEILDLEHKASNKFEAFDQNPLKTLDLTFQIGLHHYIGDKVAEIKALANVFDIKQIDNYLKEDSRSVTLRIFANEEAITLLDSHYNK